MADAIGLYVHASGAETGGTNALTGLITGGTAISADDAETAAFAFGALDTVYTLYYKAEDGGVDVGKDTTAAFTVRFKAPAWATSTSYNLTETPVIFVWEDGTLYKCLESHTSGTFATDLAADKWEEVTVAPVQVCKTYDGTFLNAPDDIPAAVGAYKPLYVKQTARQASAEADIEVGTGGVTFTTGTRPTVGTVTPTGGDASVVLAWSDIAMTGTGVYQVQRATDSGFTANVVTLTSTLADGSTGYTNNSAGGNAPSNGTAYYYRVRAVDARGIGAYSATGSVTPAVPTLGQVTNFSAGTAQDGYASLSWTAVSNATSYTIERCAKSTDPGTGSWTGETAYDEDTGVTGTTYSNTGNTASLTNGTKYWFRARAVASGYTSGAWSTADDATPAGVPDTYADGWVSASNFAPNAGVVQYLYARSTDARADISDLASVGVSCTLYYIAHTYDDYFYEHVIVVWRSNGATKTQIGDMVIIEDESALALKLQVTGTGSSVSLVVYNGATQIISVSDTSASRITDAGYWGGCRGTTGTPQLTNVQRGTL